jgi:hypothetical protein
MMTPNKPPGSVQPVTVLSADSNSFTGIPELQWVDYDSEFIARTIKESTDTISLRSFLRDTAAWIGRIVRLGGGPPPPKKDLRNRQFLEGDNEIFLGGYYNKLPFRAIGYLNHPWPSSIIFGKSVPIDYGLIVFGRILGLKRMMSDDGLMRAFANVECLAMFDSKDLTYSKPLWVTEQFRQLPEGTVTTDSLIYEIDKPK